MLIVVVGGPHSGVGKTLASERALEALAGAGFGAVKLTVADGERDPAHDHGLSALALAGAAGLCGRGASCGVCETVSARVPARLVTSERAIRKSGTDTARLADAGAVAVAWAIALREAAPRALDAAIRHVEAAGARGVLVEGTTALDWLRPALSVMVATDPGRRWKDVALRRVASCDLVLRNHPPVTSGDVAAPAALGASRPIDCDLARADDPGTARFVRSVRDIVAARA